MGAALHARDRSGPRRTSLPSRSPSVRTRSNERAILRKPLDIDDYLASPVVAEPFRAADCTGEVDGACAVAGHQPRTGPRSPASAGRLAAGAYRAGARPGLDIGDHLLWDDYSRNYTVLLRDDLFGRAGITAADVDFAEIYDCFTSTC